MEIVTYTVGELARTISRTLARVFPDEVWVQGEIRNLTRASSGHVYFTLLDSETDEPSPAALPVTLFESDKQAVNRVLARSGAVRMTDGVEVRIRGRVGYYAGRGTVQLRMTWIDTDFTLGKLAAERDRLVKSLRRRGLLERNRTLPLPLVPLRIGLITSHGSAAFADFVHELERSGFAWEVRFHDARVQGVDAVGDIVSGLHSLSAAKVDAIAIVRGGGAQTDLAVFDGEEVVLAIAACPVPVLTGIGHEIDVSIADMAARDFKTPTACAAGLVAQVAQFTTRLDELGGAIRRSSQSRLVLAGTRLRHTTKRISRSAVAVGVRERQRLGDATRRIGRGSKGFLIREEAGLDDLRKRTDRATRRSTLAASHRLDAMTAALAAAAHRSAGSAKQRVAEIEHRLGLLDPSHLLSRGWSITRTDNGTLVIDPADVADGMRLQTTVAGGRIASVVTQAQEEGNG